MTSMNRRGFLKLAGAGSALAATAAVPLVSLVAGKDGSSVSFRAETGLPAKPLPAWATHIVEGTVDVTKGTGTVYSRLLAGHPGDRSDVALPGMTRVIQITAISAVGTDLHMKGVVQDRSQLLPGESPQVTLVLDRGRNVLHTMFAGHELAVPLS